MSENHYNFRPRLPALVRFGFPRTGNHFFTFTLTGLYDLYLQDPALVWGENLESDSRHDEINPTAAYALRLRVPEVGQSPLSYICDRTGMHGEPDGLLRREECGVVLIRDPLSTIYSWSRVRRDRWEPGAEVSSDWLTEKLQEYRTYYGYAQRFLKDNPGRSRFIRYEDMVASPKILQELVEMIGQRPKLRPDFVWNVMRFKNFVGVAQRTFFREGDNAAWTRDVQWLELLESVPNFDFRELGYGSKHQYLQLADSSLTQFAAALTR